MLSSAPKFSSPTASQKFIFHACPNSLKKMVLLTIICPDYGGILERLLWIPSLSSKKKKKDNSEQRHAQPVRPLNDQNIFLSCGITEFREKTRSRNGEGKVCSGHNLPMHNASFTSFLHHVILFHIPQTAGMTSRIMVGDTCANIHMLEMVLHQTGKNGVFYIC